MKYFFLFSLFFISNLSFGQFSQEQLILACNDCYLNSSINADLDGDGLEDILYGTSKNKEIGWFKTIDGNLTLQEAISSNVDSPNNILASDLDGDGDMDVLFSSYKDNKIAWYPNNGSGIFLAQKSISLDAKKPSLIITADLDQDNDLDVVSLSELDGQVIWYSNDGSEVFSDQKILDSGLRGMSTVHVVDIDADLDNDILVGTIDSRGVFLYQNNGNGTFSNRKIIFEQIESPLDIWADDVNQDQYVDIVVSTLNEIFYFENDGQGGFLEQELLGFHGFSLSVQLTDMDADGDKDLLYSSYFDNTIGWYENNNGEFSRAEIINSNISLPTDAYSIDINKDGDLDVVSISETEQSLYWYENLQDYLLSIKVFADINYNCTQEESEKGINREVQIRGLPSQTAKSFFTNESGILQKRFGTTEQDTAIEVRLLDTPNRINGCPTAFIVQKYERVDISLPVQLKPCPSLTVDIGIPFLRRCFDNTYSVNYCNNSTEDIENGKVAIQLDSFFTIIHSDLPYEDKGANLYDFILPTINSGNCGDFQFTINLSCEATLGQTHCVEAHAFPDTCAIQSLDWTGASLRVASTCEQGEAKFTISNEGNGDMRQHQSLIIVEDATIIKEREIRLGKGATETIFLPATGATYQAYINQVPNHPGRSAPIAHVEGCGGIRTTGLVNTFPKDDQDLFKAIDCQENIGAYDPNDKAATPVGLETEHYLASNTDIKYKIRFQNTGTDTAFNIVIWDTLSTHLNAATLEGGASSHPYQLDRFRDSIIGLDRIRFTFSNIMLPDSNTNEAASHGFVQFRIQQQPDLPDGIIIENKAAIYFDFNEPIITNVVHHTIGFPLTRLAVSSTSEALSSDRVLITPNPFGDFITVNRMLLSTDLVDFFLFDVTGRKVTTLLLQNTTQQISTTHLEKGLYFYRAINEKGQVIGNGKIVKQ